MRHPAAEFDHSFGLGVLIRLAISGMAIALRYHPWRLTEAAGMNGSLADSTLTASQMALAVRLTTVCVPKSRARGYAYSSHTNATFFGDGRTRRFGSFRPSLHSC